MSQTARRSPGRPPAQEAAGTRERILRAAREVFSELGYEAATLQTIAERSDLTRPAISHHFTGKRQLYAEVAHRTTTAVVAEGVERARLAPPTLVARLLAFVASAVQVDLADRSAAAFLVTAVLESRRHPELIPSQDDPLVGSRQFIAWAVTDAISSGELAADTDVEALVEMLVAVLWGMGFYAGFVGDHDKLERITGQLEKLLENRLWDHRNR